MERFGGSGAGRGPTRRAALGGAGALALGAAVPLARAAGAEPAAELVASRGTAQLGPEGTGPADIWGYDGAVPGPVLRVRQGTPLAADLVNRLDQPTTVHWHGIRIDNAMDGVAGLTQAPVAPGGSFAYRFTPPDAGTYWYHPHNRSWEQLARGLYGALIVEEAEPPEVDSDRVLILDDWRLTADGALDEESFGSGHDWSHAGRLGNWPTLNGAPQPVLPARLNERMRLRLLNAGNATVLVPRLDGMRAWLVAADGQPVPVTPLEGEFVLAPAQRVDVIADVLAEDARLMLAGREDFEMARFEVAAAQRSAPLGDPAPLPPNPLSVLSGGGDALVVDLPLAGGAMRWLERAEAGDHPMSSGAALGGVQDGRALAGAGLFWAMGGVAGMPAAPLFEAERGRQVRLTFRNDTAFPHGMHLHGHHVLDPRTGFWRDTVLVERGETVEVAFVAENPGDWMLHCHMLEHQAAGMATWFRVL